MLIKEKRNTELDILRGIAIILTLQRHLSYLVDWAVTSLPFWIWQTWTGVDLFFAISGFVVSKSLYSRFATAQDSNSRITDILKLFYISRFFRLIPTSIFWISIQLFFAAAFSKSGFFGEFWPLLYEAFFTITYFYNYYLLTNGSKILDFHWSLAVEEQFYLIYPLFLITFSTIRSRLIILITIIFAINFFIRPIFAPIGTPIWPDLLAPTHFRVDGIVMGCVVFWISFLPFWKILLSKISAIAHHGKFITLLLVSLLIWLPAFATPLQTVGMPLVTISCSILVFLASFEINIISFGDFTNKILLWLGHRSYSIYLIHMFVFRFTKFLLFYFENYFSIKFSLFGNLVFLIFGLALLLVLSDLSYRFIEKNFMKYGNRVVTRKF